MFRSVLVRAAVMPLPCASWRSPPPASALPGARVLGEQGQADQGGRATRGSSTSTSSTGRSTSLPGQNNIEAHLNRSKPKVPGYITRFKPNLVYSGTHKVPRVDVIHLHHGVWLANGYPTFAAGEEKTTSSSRAATATTTTRATAGS